jgi:hypothetical protein
MLLHKYKLYAALAFTRANKLNRVIIDGPNRRFGIVTCGKTYMDVRQALDDLGIDDDYAKRIGLSLYKVGMTWPLEREGVRHFAEGLEEILVVEEKRALMENQLKEQLYNWKESVRPKVVGKFDESGEWILPFRRRADAGAHRARDRQAHRALPHQPGDRRPAEVPGGEGKGADRLQARHPARRLFLLRLPAQYLDQGCRKGSRALAGIGCHIMASWMDRGTETFTQMGGEGATWIGQAPFSKTRHVFQNLGDGTYYHSGPAGDPRRGRLRRQHHLQDPVQRRRCDDRRPAGRRAADRADDRPSIGVGGACQDHRRHRRRGKISDRPISRRACSSIIATSWIPSSARCARSRASPPSSTTRPAPRRNAGGASAA